MQPRTVGHCGNVLFIVVTACNKQLGKGWTAQIERTARRVAQEIHADIFERSLEHRQRCRRKQIVCVGIKQQVGQHAQVGSSCQL